MRIDVRPSSQWRPPADIQHWSLFFIVVWIGVGIASSIFYSKASYETKKLLHPFLVIGLGVMFLSFAEWLTQGHLPWIFAVAVVIVLFLNIRMTRFCSRCGATIYARFLRMSFCPKCGAALQ